MLICHLGEPNTRWARKWTLKRKTLNDTHLMYERPTLLGRASLRLERDEWRGGGSEGKKISNDRRWEGGPNCFRLRSFNRKTLTDKVKLELRFMIKTVNLKSRTNYFYKIIGQWTRLPLYFKMWSVDVTVPLCKRPLTKFPCHYRFNNYSIGTNHPASSCPFLLGHWVGRETLSVLVPLRTDILSRYQSGVHVRVLRSCFFF